MDQIGDKLTDNDGIKELIMGSEVMMRETSSGHFSLKIDTPKIGLNFEKCISSTSNCDEEVSQCLLSSEKQLKRQDVEKLHHVFGHVSIKRLKELISKSNKMTDEVESYLEEIQEKCKSCKRNRIAKPKPAVGLPRASAFNQVVTVDLKQYKEKNYKYIIYMVIQEPINHW